MILQLALRIAPISRRRQIATPEFQTTHGRVRPARSSHVDRVALGLVDDVDLVVLREQELLRTVAWFPGYVGRDMQPISGPSLKGGREDGIWSVRLVCSWCIGVAVDEKGALYDRARGFREMRVAKSRRPTSRHAGLDLRLRAV